jgi:hypothetical protein
MTDSCRPLRLFTLQEAERLLPEIEPLVAEMRSILALVRAEITEASDEVGVEAADPRLSEHLEKRGVAPPLISRVNDLVRTVHAHGCVVNGPEAGLVDFPAFLGSEIVFLCWKHGEQRILHWHRIPDGFSGRRPFLQVDGPRAHGATVH